MTERDRLAATIETVLRRVKFSNGYDDTAAQVAEALREQGFDVDQWEEMQRLRREVDEAHIDRNHAQWQLRSRIASERESRKRDLVSKLQDAMNAQFEDGASVMEYVLARNPDLAARLRAIFD